MKPLLFAHAVLAELQVDATPADNRQEQTLTPRETGILKQLENGHSCKEISADLNVSTHTVHTRITSIYRKLQAHGKAEAIRKGRARGVL